MTFTVFGLNHRTAGLGLRERLAVSSESLPRALEAARLRLGAGVILSTCNRTELYTDGQGPPLNFFVEYFEVKPEELHSHTYIYRNEECVRHLFQVASGLDSMVLGEAQVLGQIRSAYSAAVQAGAAHGPLSRLFHQALRVGKRVRTETAIGRNSLSMSGACVQMVRGTLGDLAPLTVLVLGVGEAGKLAGRALRAAGVSRLMIVNRTLEKAKRLAEELAAEPIPFSSLASAVVGADVVIACAGSPEPLLSRGDVADAMKGRPGRPLFLMDLAVPRDIEPSAGDVPNVHLRNVDDLESISRANRAERERAAREAEAIVAQEVEAFMEWSRGLEVVPTVAALQQRAEEIRRQELDKTLKRLHSLSSDDAQRLDALTQAIVKKLLHEPIANLKARRSPSQLQLARELFALDEAHAP